MYCTFVHCTFVRHTTEQKEIARYYNVQQYWEFFPGSFVEQLFNSDVVRPKYPGDLP